MNRAIVHPAAGDCNEMPRAPGPRPGPGNFSNCCERPLGELNGGMADSGDRWLQQDRYSLHGPPQTNPPDPAFSRQENGPEDHSSTRRWGILTSDGTLIERSRIRRQAFALGILLWTLLGLVTARGYMLLAGVNGTEVSLLQALGKSLPQWMAWAILTLPVLKLVAWVPIRLDRLPARILFHLAAAPVFIGLHLVLTVQIAHPTDVYSETVALWTRLATVGRVMMAYDFLVYICLVGICHAVMAYESHREQTLRSAQRSVSLAQAQFHAMVLRLRPESLLPVLSEIAARIRSDSGSARRMISRLGELLRSSFHDVHTSMVPLSRELVYLDLYLDVLRELHGDRLRSRYDIGQGTYDAQVPPFLLQPLVQLTVGDVCWAGPKGALLEVCAHREANWICLLLQARASDAAMSDRTVLLPSIEATANSISARLAEIYSAQVRVEVRAVADRLTIQITLPLRTSKERSAA